MERITLFADVLLPLPVSGTFTYRVPFELNDQISPGIRVVVQFGSRKIYTALVLKVHDQPPGRTPKYVLSILDQEPVVRPVQMNFWKWLADYYLCTAGEVMNAALPAALKLASESKIALNPAFNADLSVLNERQVMLVEALHHRKVIAVSEVSKILELQKTIPVIKSLIDLGVIVSDEELTDPYKPKLEPFLRLCPPYSEQEDLLTGLFSRLEKSARKQSDILMTLLRISGFGAGSLKEVSQKELMKQSGGGQTSLDGLIGKGILERYHRMVSRFAPEVAEKPVESIELSEVQEKTLDAIRAEFKTRDVVLLHGVTSSGKTELYIKLIQETISQGKQVLFMLPEIALTAQIINRLRKYFGARVGIYHSRFNHHERVEVWHSVLHQGPETRPGEQRYDIVLGARSALFLPFSNLGLVIVDEEHDSSFKQYDPAPRYHGRDAALYLARLHGAKTLLGSATPSVESYFNALSGKYALVELTERYGKLELPAVQVINLKEARRIGMMKSHFSTVLLEEIEATLSRKEQVIIFQNRRGFSLRLECDLCHWMPACKFCDVTLVYHKKINQLRCHYCGYVSKIPEQCPDCHGTNIRMRGFGTEKVEEELGVIFPDAVISRMDLDTTRSKNSHQKIIEDFQEGKVDILVGTQMVTKGLDFDHVSLVCILNADNMLNYPDFRSAERAYQLMAQVSGRSGRKGKQGKVVIQSYNPEHMIIRDVVTHNYLAMFRQQIAERQKFRYPPYYRLIQIKLKHRDADALNRAADELATMLRQQFGKRVLGPEFPMVSRIMNYYIKNILLKIEREPSLVMMKEKLMTILGEFQKRPAARSVRIIPDVDPQ